MMTRGGVKLQTPPRAFVGCSSPGTRSQDYAPAIWMSVCIIWSAVLITLELAW
jgi:hypothetical protein